MDCKFVTHGRDNQCIKFWSENLKETVHLEDLGVDRQNNLKTYLKRIGWEKEWVHLVQRAPVYIFTNLSSSIKNFLPGSANIKLSKGVPLHGDEHLVT